MPKEDNTNQSSPFEIVATSKSKGIKPKSVIIVILLLLFLGVSVFLGVYLVSQRQNIAEKAAPATTIYVNPSAQTQSAGSNFSFTVNMDTSTNAVTGVDVRLKFDPNAVQIVSLTQGAGVVNLNQTITNMYDNTAGTVAYAIFTLDGSKAVSGTNVEVLKINASVKAGAPNGISIISFDPATAAAASQEGQNVLVSKNQGTVTVTAGTNATAAPTATPASGSSPTPTVNATATPVPTNGATNAPQATQTPMPIPETGSSWATYLGVGFGVFAIVASILIAI